MAKYIDADKLIKDYTDIFTEYGIELAEQFQGVINQSPTADVVERSEYNMMAERCKAMTNAFIELQKDNKDLHSKIDKTIEEIENEIKFWEHPANYQEPLEVQRNKLAKANSYRHALEILKNNIGK